MYYLQFFETSHQKSTFQKNLKTGRKQNHMLFIIQKKTLCIFALCISVSRKSRNKYYYFSVKIEHIFFHCFKNGQNQKKCEKLKYLLIFKWILLELSGPLEMIRSNLNVPPTLFLSLKVPTRYVHTFKNVLFRLTALSKFVILIEMSRKLLNFQDKT